jgi:hypothetical protein
LPATLLAIVIAIALRPGSFSALQGIASVKAGASARLTQASALADREKDPAPAASVCGAHYRGRKCTQTHNTSSSGSCRARALRDSDVLEGESTLMKTMSKWERVEAALHGAEVDRVPISLWKHYHLQDRAPGQLAEVTVGNPAPA